MQLIPAIDLIDGRCVRLTKGDYNEKKVYDADPVEWAKELQDHGITRLHVVDLDGAKSSEPKNLATLERIAQATSLDIEWGGGIKSADALHAVFESGAQRAICGSIAVDKPNDFAQWLQTFGNSHIILGADVRNGMISTHGWLKDSTLTISDVIRQFLPYGLTQVICTDISRDGMLQGPNFPLYTKLLQEFPDITLTLSGGVSSKADLLKAETLGLHAAIIGKALYEGKITLNEL